MVENASSNSEDLTGDRRNFQGYSNLVSRLFSNNADTVAQLQRISADPWQSRVFMGTIDMLISRRILAGKPKHLQSLALTEKEQKVLTLRFGLGERAGGTLFLKQVGEQLDKVSKERARQIEASALRKLRHPTVS